MIRHCTLKLVSLPGYFAYLNHLDSAIQFLFRILSSAYFNINLQLLYWAIISVDYLALLWGKLEVLSSKLKTMPEVLSPGVHLSMLKVPRPFEQQLALIAKTMHDVSSAMQVMSLKCD